MADFLSTNLLYSRRKEKPMSAAPKIIEGTWEEILKHSAEFAGHKLKVIVIDESADSEKPFDHPAFDNSPEAIEAWVARLRQWAQSLPPVTHFVDDSRDAIYADRLDRQL